MPSDIPTVQEALNALQQDDGPRFPLVTDRTRLSITSLLQQETTDVPFSREETTKALRAILLKNDPQQLLDRGREDEEPTQDRENDAFYVPYGYGPDWTDVLLWNMVFNNYNEGGGTSVGGCGDCGDCDDDGAAVVCAIAAICSAFACCYFACKHSGATCEGPETSFVKSVKVIANILTFLAVSGGGGYLAYTHQNEWQPKSMSNTAYIALAAALSFAGGMGSALLVAWLNKANPCLPSAPKPYVVPDNLLDELTQISRLLQGEWLGESQLPGESYTLFLERRNQTKDFIRVAVQTYIDKQYQPKDQLKIVVEPNNSPSSTSTSGLNERLLPPPRHATMERKKDVTARNNEKNKKCNKSTPYIA